MNRFLCLFVFMFLQSSALAQIASIRVDHDSGSEVKSGTIVKLEAAVKEDPDTTVIYKWKLSNPPSGYNVNDFIEGDGKRVYFATGAVGSYQFDLVIVSVKGKDDIKIEWLEHTVQVVGINHQPPPGIPPTIPPVTPPSVPPVTPPVTPPVSPNPSFGMAPITTALANAVNDPDKKTTATNLSLGYLLIATRISTGKITSPNVAKAEVVAANRKALSAEKKELWKSFAIGLSKELNTLESAGSFKSIDDYRLVFIEIAEGLSKVK